MDESTTGPEEGEARPGGSPGCCTAGHDPTGEEVAADVRTLATLGNDTRYESLRFVARADGDVYVCELESAFGVSQDAVSQALSGLSGVGLVERRKEGRWRYYAPTPRAERLLAVLDGRRSGPMRDETTPAKDGSELESMLSEAGVTGVAIELESDSESFVRECDGARDPGDHVASAIIEAEKPAR